MLVRNITLFLFYWWDLSPSEIKAGLYDLERRACRTDMGLDRDGEWKTRLSFFELILISNVHSLAEFFYDCPTESLFVCLMKHTEGWVLVTNCLCKCACVCHICMYPFNGPGAYFAGALLFHWQEQEAIAVWGRWKKSQGFVFSPIQNSCFR